MSWGKQNSKAIPKIGILAGSLFTLTLSLLDVCMTNNRISNLSIVIKFKDIKQFLLTTENGNQAFKN